MAFRRFRKQFEYRNEAGEKVTIPRNWAGELPDKVAADADAAKATLVEKVVRSEPAQKALDDMTKEELIDEAKRRNVEIKASDNKAEILAALKAAETPAG